MLSATTDSITLAAASAASAHDLLAGYQCHCAACAGLNLAHPAAQSGNGGAGGQDLSHSIAASAPSVAQGLAVDALLAGTRWAGGDGASGTTVITYSFADPATSVFAAEAQPYQASIHAFSDAERAVTRELLGKIEAVCNVHFVEVADNAARSGAVRYAYSDQPNAMGFAGYAYFPSDADAGGTVWIGNAQAGAQWDFYRPNLILHETLHAIGLKHPFDGGATLDAQDNIIPNTVMSYSAIAGSPAGSLSAYPAEPMALDTQALQALYGAAAHNDGDTVYNLASQDLQSGFHALWDSGGNDTLDASGVARGVTLDLGEGARSDIGAQVTAFAYAADGSHSSMTYTDTLSLAGMTSIENAIGSTQADVLRGNAVANSLRGGDGNDTLEGRGGNDQLDGGSGIDIAVYAGVLASFRIDQAGGAATVADTTGREGTDTLASVERLAFSDTHVALDLDGNAGTAAKILGVVVGAQAVHNTWAVGQVIRMLDAGDSALEAADAVIEAAVGAPFSNYDFVVSVFHHLTGAAPGADDLGYYKGLLDSGAQSQASLTLLAAGTGANAVNIDLVGLAAHGIDYLAA